MIAQSRGINCLWIVARHQRYPCSTVTFVNFSKPFASKRTTCVSAGDAGANNFAGFRRYIAAQTRTRLYAFVHIANIGLAGFPVAELYNIDFAQTDAAAKAIAENSDMVLGAKVRMSENVIAKHGLEPLKRAIAACEQAGGVKPSLQRPRTKAAISSFRHRMGAADYPQLCSVV
jgi:predicted amidohydrolase